jgi:lycopene beta-cyclase
VVEVLISGSGPAGWALADQCARLGLHTAIVAPKPWRTWHATYGVWHDELAAMPPDVAATPPMTMRAVTTEVHHLSRPYAVLDNARLRGALASADIEVIEGRVIGAVSGPRGCTVRLADGRPLAAAVVVDATGAHRALSGGRARGPRAEQTAVGVVVPEQFAQPVLGSDQAVFMDWSPLPGHRPWPTFLYAVPVGGGRVLLEETSLARRPGLAMDTLRSALHARLAIHGVRLPDATAQEWVRIPLDLPLPGPGQHYGQIIPFGVCAGMVHPATGYSIGEVFRLAPRVAAAIAAELPTRPAAAARAARHVIWPLAARMVHLLRRGGLATLLSLPPDQVRAFFSLFFRSPDDLQSAYLSGWDDLAGTTASMAWSFRHASWTLRARMLAAIPQYAPNR